MAYRVVLHHSDEGYSVSVPELPGCFSQGATKREALANIRGAIHDYVEVAQQLGISLEETSLALERKAADPDALSFMPGPKDVASREAYDAWVRAKIQKALDDPRPPVPHEEVMAHFAKRRAEALASSKK